MRIGYSKMDSDVIAKMKGTFQERPKKTAVDKGGKKSKKVKVSIFYLHISDIAVFSIHLAGSHFIEHLKGVSHEF